MKFLIAKNDDLFCFYGQCGSQILTGEHYVGLFFVKEGRKRTLIFHVECYRKWHDELIVRKHFEWEQGTVPKKREPKRGRPRKYKNYLKADRIRGLLYYYRKAGNEAKVLELEAKLEGLKVA